MLGKTKYWYKHRFKEKIKKNDFEEDFFKLMKNAFFCICKYKFII